MSEGSPLRVGARPIFTGEEIDLRQLLRAVWRYRTLMIGVIVAFTTMGAAFSLASTRHMAEGLLQVPSLTVAEYKRYVSMVSSKARMREFLRRRGLEDTRPGGQLLWIVDSPERINDAVQPVFALTGAEVREFDIKSESSAELVGIRLRVEYTEASEESLILLLTQYVRDSIIEEDLRDAVVHRCIQEQARLSRLRNQGIADQFQVREHQARAEYLRAIIESRPKADLAEARQVVSIESGGERFLRPTTQLVAVELAINEFELAKERRVRELRAAGLRQSYYCSARVAADTDYFGSEFLDVLATLSAKALENENLEDKVVEFTKNEIEIERQGWSDHHLVLTRFIASPEGNEKMIRRPQLSVGLLLGLLSGSLAGVVLVLLLAWWHDHRDEVIVDEST